METLYTVEMPDLETLLEADSKPQHEHYRCTAAINPLKAAVQPSLFNGTMCSTFILIGGIREFEAIKWAHPEVEACAQLPS